MWGALQDLTGPFGAPGSLLYAQYYFAAFEGDPHFAECSNDRYFGYSLFKSEKSKHVRANMQTKIAK